MLLTYVEFRVSALLASVIRTDTAGWTCQLAEGAPICDPSLGSQLAAGSVSGEKFFSLLEGNLPVGFSADMGAAVPKMAGFLAYRVIVFKVVSIITLLLVMTPLPCKP